MFWQPLGLVSIYSVWIWRHSYGKAEKQLAALVTSLSQRGRFRTQRSGYWWWKLSLVVFPVCYPERVSMFKMPFPQFFASFRITHVSLRLTFFFYSFFPSYFSTFSYYWGLFHLMHLRARFSSRCTSPSSITLSVRADKHLPTDEARRREERKAQVEQLWRIDTGQGGGITRCRKITPTLAYMP